MIRLIKAVKKLIPYSTLPVNVFNCYKLPICFAPAICGPWIRPLTRFQLLSRYRHRQKAPECRWARAPDDSGGTLPVGSRGDEV